MNFTAENLILLLEIGLAATKLYKKMKEEILPVLDLIKQLYNAFFAQ